VVDAVTRDVVNAHKLSDRKAGRTDADKSLPGILNRFKRTVPLVTNLALGGLSGGFFILALFRLSRELLLVDRPLVVVHYHTAARGSRRGIWVGRKRIQYAADDVLVHKGRAPEHTEHRRHFEEYVYIFQNIVFIPRIHQGQTTDSVTSRGSQETRHVLVRGPSPDARNEHGFLLLLRAEMRLCVLERLTESGLALGAKALGHLYLPIRTVVHIFVRVFLWIVSEQDLPTRCHLRDDILTKYYILTLASIKTRAMFIFQQIQQ
jgi:hypothetical protein